MNQSNSILAKRIAELERRLSNTKTTANTLLEENRQLLVELASVKNLLESSMLSEATAKQYAKEIDKQNQELVAQVESLLDDRKEFVKKEFQLLKEIERLEIELKKRDEQNAALATQVEALKRDAVPNEQGKNRYGLDVAYFRNVINRELNRSLMDFKPSELARVFARLSRTADDSVLLENEFIGEHLAEIRAQAGRAGFVEGVRQEMLDRFGLFYHDTRGRADKYADSIRRGEVSDEF